MPVTTETLRDTKRLNVVFAASALVALVSMVWMFWHDYNRQWRGMQRNYFNVRSAMAHFEALRYETPEEKQKYAQLLAAVREAEEELSEPDKQRREKELIEQEKILAGELQGVALTYGNMNAEMQVRLFDYEEYRTLHGERHPRTLRIAADNARAEERLKEAKARLDELEDDLRIIREQLRDLYRRRNDAQRVLAAYEKGLSDAQRLDRMYSPGFTRAFFNMPLLDYLAPQGTPGREEVRQVFMKPIRFDYNFVDSYVTDRCMTCHVGIDDPNLTVESFANRTAAALNNPAVQQALQEANTELRTNLMERLARAGQQKEFATADLAQLSETQRGDFVRAMLSAANDYLRDIKRPVLPFDEMQSTLGTGADLTRGKVTDAIVARVEQILWARPPMIPGKDKPLSWRDMDEGQRMAYVAALAAAMNTYLVDQGRPPIDFRKEVQAHPNLDLYVSPDSPHPMGTMGCTVCHEGAGQDTDFILAAHTPKDKAEKKRWEKEYYVKELGIPLATFHLVEEFWERPMLLPDYTSASCTKCHDQTFDLERYKTLPLDEARRIVEGRELFTSIGCINCHNVDGLTDSRMVGTDLTHVGEKLTTAFMERWVEYPKNFRPGTWMPHFFHQENSLPSSANEFDPDPMLRTETEIQSIVHYLQTFTKSLAFKELPEGVEGDPKRGEELFVSIGCLACHANLDARDPMASDGRTIGETWITKDLAMTLGLSEDEAKSQYESMSENARVQYAVQKLTPQRREEAIARAEKEEAVADLERRDPDPVKMYVPPAFTRVAPELSGMGTKLIPDPDNVGQAERAKRWLYNWLRDPRHYASNTLMPRMFRDHYYQLEDAATQAMKNDQDMLDVSAYLLSLRNDDFDMTPIPYEDRHVQMAQSLILDLLGGQNTQSVAEMILSDEKVMEDDPFGRLTSAIVAQTYRSFGGGEDGRRQVAELIASRSASLVDRQKLYLGMKMIGHYGCYACHSIAGFEDVTRPGTDVTLWAQKFMSQLDFAFYSPAFEHDVEENPALFENLYIDQPEYEHLVRDAGGNAPADILHNHASFAYYKMRNPRIWDRAKIKKPFEKLKMPNFYLSEDESRSLTAYMLSMRDASVMNSVKIDYERTPAGKIARGRALARELNCIGCHDIEGNNPNINQYYTMDPGVGDDYPFGHRFLPPLLWGEGAKVQYPWLFTFLNNVEMLRPWLNVRMPSFNLTKEEATTLVEYFAGLSQDEAHMLKAELSPVIRYLREVHGTATGVDSAADGDRAWFLQEKLAPQAQFLQSYAIAKNQIRAFELNDPDSQTPAEVADFVGPVYDKIVQRAEFLARTFDVRYPFTDPDTHLTDEERFRRGEEFFYELKCLACHVGGDPSVPGTTTDIKAPNFSLTYKRLQYDWVVKWLQDPQAIQPGANMPQIFLGGSAFAMMPEESRKELEDKYYSTMDEQAALLVDFLFNMGERRYTAIQPGGLEAPTAAPEQPAVDFDFDGDGEEKKPEPVEFDFD